MADPEDLENVFTSEVHVKRFMLQEVSHEETPSVPCADGTLILLDLPRPRRHLKPDNWGQEEEASFEEEHGNNF